VNQAFAVTAIANPDKLIPVDSSQQTPHIAGVIFTIDCSKPQNSQWHASQFCHVDGFLFGS